MCKNKSIKCYGFVMVYYHCHMHTLRNPKDHTISSWLGAGEKWKCLYTNNDMTMKTLSIVCLKKQ